MDLDEYELRKQKYFPFRAATWITGIIFLILLIDFFFFRRTLLPDVKDPIKIYLVVGMISYDCFFYHTFQTEFLGKVSNLSLMEKIKIVGFNLVCLGWIFDIFR
tara:strand:+ start:97 stop:408 length:312 start_codon:yes stop_codon:yes gene_type:complete